MLCGVYHRKYCPETRTAMDLKAPRNHIISVPNRGLPMNQAKSPARIEPLSPETSPDLKRVFEGQRSMYGFLPNALLIMQRKPKMVMAIQQMVASVWGPDNKVDRGLKHLIAHVASRSAGCQYCMAHTAEVALRVGLDEKKLAAIWDYQTSPLFSGAERSALDLAVAGATVPNAVTDEMFANLRKYWDEEQIVEIVGVIALLGFLNRFNDILAVPLEDQPLATGQKYLAPHGWTPGKHRP
jgi:uncharacterized peroxidase-related enzyme